MHRLPALFALAASLLATPARAEPVPTASSFGPKVTIERIDVAGNQWTNERLIRRALLVKEGQTLRAGDGRFRSSRIRVLALGYFSAVDFRLDRGTARGKVVLVVVVAERSTITLHQLLWGTTEATPLWLGLDIGDANFFGTGLDVSAAVLWARQAKINGARPQLGLRLRYGDPSVFGTAASAHATFLFNRASEPWTDDPSQGGGPPNRFNAFSYNRIGGVFGVGLDVTRLSSVIVDVRFENIDSDVRPALASAQRFLQGDKSQLLTLAVGYERDTRSDPILTTDGLRILASAEMSGAILGTDYTYLRLVAGASRWFSLSGPKHVLSVHASASAIVGDAPFFDEWFTGDVTPLVTPRSLDLVLSTLPSRNVFDTSINNNRYGDVTAAAAVEYAYRLFTRKERVYGGVIFVRAGVFALGRFSQLDEGAPVDLLVDVGMRLDTEIGVFELTLGNGIGRIPL